MRVVLTLLSLLLVSTVSTPALAKKTDYTMDMQFAVDAIGKECRALIKSKGLKWKKIGKGFVKEAKGVKNDLDYGLLLIRLIAKLRDGHAYVKFSSQTENLDWPWKSEKKAGPGMFWSRIGDKIFVKNSWGQARGAGIKPGYEIVSVNGKKALAWLEERVAERSERQSFSTDHQAFWAGCAWGLAEPVGTRVVYDVKTEKGKLKKKRKVDIKDDNYVPSGPAFMPKKLDGNKDVHWGRTEKGYGYIHYRRCKGTISQHTDEALAALGDVRGLVLDFRGNGGGGFDHDAFMGRFIPTGKSMSFSKSYASAGDNPYGGPIVVIVNGTTRSAGETGSGIFKEDGRAYMIGESPTAGMSSSKTTIALPSGLYSLYVSVHSNMGRFNKGKGIEGIGVVPHEIVEYEPDDLADERDTLILRAEALLADFPQKKVKYVPKKFGWKPSKKRRK